MKTIKLICLLSLFVICGCNNSTMNSDTDEKGPKKSDDLYYMYSLYVNIQDASGVDLIRGIESEDWCSNCDEGIGTVKKDFYSLEVVFPVPCQDSYALHNKPRVGYIPDELTPKLGLRKLNNRYYLEFSTNTFVNPWGEYENCPPAEKITLKLTCPFLFGDDISREIVTFWQESKIVIGKQLCSKIEIEGYTVSSQIEYDKSQNSVASVILKTKASID